MPYPNFRNKHRARALVSPDEYLAYLRSRGKASKIDPLAGVILCYQRSLFEHVVKTHKVAKIGGFYGDMRRIVGTNVALVGGFGIGAPVAAIVLEELIGFGVRRFISVGTAGALQKDLDIGSLVVCDRAIRDEGTSHHYLAPGKYAYPSKSLTQRLKGQRSGATWTIDAPYRETVEEVRRWQREGVLTVEMEAAALFAVAEHRGAEIGALFTISDSLADLRWKPAFHYKATADGLEKLFQVALDALLGL